MPPYPPHTAAALYLTCMDDRLVPYKEQRKQELAQRFHAVFDPTMAGGALAPLSHQTEAATLLQIKAAYDISHISDVFLETHLDCGANQVLLGRKFESQQEEIATLWHDLDKAKGAVEELGLPLKVHLSLVDPNGESVPRP
jgi:carbonic anhydrase